jgi:putative membrane protein
VRNLIRFLLGICQQDDDDDESLLTDSDWRVRIILLAMAQTHALRSQLRPYCKSDVIPALQERDRFLEQESLSCIEKLVKSQNPANAILMRASEILGKESGLSTYSLIHASRLVDRLCEIHTSCERIHNTTLPFAYSLLVHRTSVSFPISQLDSLYELCQPAQSYPCFNCECSTCLYTWHHLQLSVPWGGGHRYSQPFWRTHYLASTKW